MPIDQLNNFLRCATPEAWLQAALCQQDILLIDHANCEKKAAWTALNLMFRYIEHPALQQKLSRLAREELRHFEQVARLMQQRGISYQPVSASLYAQRLRTHIRPSEPEKLIDTLIVGAFIEARSCERFALLATQVDAELATFYRSLLASEARHYQDYLGMAERFSASSIEERIAFFAEVERAAILSIDTELRFHSGVPASSNGEGG